VWKNLTDVSEMLAASIIRAMLEAAKTFETSANFTRLQVATTQKTAIFVLAALRT
jgi:hypothetical protein